MGIKKKVHEEEKLERWLVSYADFITLLFAFFTVMYALSLKETSQKQEAIEAIERAVQSGGGPYSLKGIPFTPFTQAPNQGALSPPPADALGQQAHSREAMERVQEKIEKLFEKNTGLSLAPHDIEVFATKDGFRIRLSESTLFGSGSARIKRENVPFLYEMGQRLKALGMEIQVEGHTDNVRPADKTNWQLSLDRSVNIAKFLVEATDYPQNKLGISGFGDTQPISSNRSREGRARNRRVEIAVITGETQVQQLPW